MPRSSASGVTSMIFTGKPWSAKLMAMPPPIVPAPTTAAVAKSRTGVLAGRSGSLATSRSMKNA